MTITRYSQLGKLVGKNHYRQPCAACGEPVAAFKGSHHINRTGEHHAVHACCTPIMRLLETSSYEDRHPQYSVRQFQTEHAR